ncbi:MAG: glycosyltransferase family 2 protein [Candidatus Spechtbacteria bacterium SB0662_bin_43]|uniref:Glycosyltransferase family 2 protein n=1 Tax=Candidatus Spechtbacteria bacterium SB0662_bin_43 TaxID=2604897 RepID=A0A845DA40_9BACT|nr:glycosyltransferase family 2 protein [Candidatus Spechtbacteria bacterium SB0662_bin_43]
MDVSIIVNHYRLSSVLELSLTYLLKWQKEYEMRNGEGSTEIIVVDSGTTRKTREMVSTGFPSIVFLSHEHNIGFGKSVNAGLKRAQGSFIFILNADCIVPYPKEIDVLLDYLKQQRHVGLVGPQLLNFDNTHQHSAFRFYTPLTILARRTPFGRTTKGVRAIERFIMARSARRSNEGTNVDWLMGSALLTKKKYVEKVGLFDEQFFMYMEDVDWCRRFWEAGLRVMYCPASKIYHFHGKASRNKNPLAFLFNKYTRIHLMSAYKYFKKYGTKAPSYTMKY